MKDLQKKKRLGVVLKDKRIRKIETKINGY